MNFDFGLHDLNHHIVEINGDITDAGEPTNQPKEQEKIELLSQ